MTPQDTARVETKIFHDLIGWARENAPNELQVMMAATDQKAAARDLLLFRIGNEESFVHELPDSLIVKLGGEVDHVFDDRERSLATVIGARLERRIR